MNKVLIADDNTQITKVLKDYASKEGWGCYVAYNGEEALRLFREFSREITIVFLDVMMPRKDGFAVCKAIRAMSQVPVIMITARSEDADKIMGLDIGADDYIVKPFSAAEVMARARAILRRIPQQEESKSRKLVIANLTIDIDNYMVTIDDKEVPLTKREKELLWLLASNSKKSVLPGQPAGQPLGLRLFWRQPNRGFPYQTAAGQTGRLRPSRLERKNHLGRWLPF